MCQVRSDLKRYYLILSDLKIEDCIKASMFCDKIFKGRSLMRIRINKNLTMTDCKQ